MHRELVERKRWVSESQYLRTLNFCMLLPGPEAQQVATYIGWRLHGTVGGIVAGSFFVIPSIFVLWLLSYLAVAHSDVPAITGLLYGIQPVVIAIVVEAVLRIARRALNHYLLVGFSVAAFVALYFLSVHFPLVVLAAGLGGLLLGRVFPEAFESGGHGDSQEEESAVDRVESGGLPSMLRNLRLLLTFAVLWAVPVGALFLWRGGNDVLVDQALFFTGAAFVTFGGAYAVLSYISDVAVGHYGWLTADQMVQGLGLAEAIDHGHRVRGVYRGVQRPRFLRPLALRDVGGFDHHLRDVSALLPVHLLARPLHRASGQQPKDQCRPRGGHRSRGRCDRQPCSVLRHAGAFPRGCLFGGPRHLRPCRGSCVVCRTAEVQGSDLPHGPCRCRCGYGMDTPLGDPRKTRWLILIYHLPREPSRHRVAVWRKLKALGALYLQDGAAALPDDAVIREQLEWLQLRVREAGERRRYGRPCPIPSPRTGPSSKSSAPCARRCTRSLSTPRASSEGRPRSGLARRCFSKSSQGSNALSGPSAGAITSSLRCVRWRTRRPARRVAL